MHNDPFGADNSPMNNPVPNDMEPNDMSLEQHDKFRMIFRRENDALVNNKQSQRSNIHMLIKPNKGGEHSDLEHRNYEKIIIKRNVGSLDLKRRDLKHHNITKTHKKLDIVRNIFDDFVNEEKSINKYSKYANNVNKNNKTINWNSGELEYLVRNRREDEYLPTGVNKNDLNFYGFACICPIRFKGQKCEG